MTEAVFAYEIGFFVVIEVCKKVKHLVILLSHNEKTPWIFSRGLFCIYVTAFVSHVCYGFLIDIPAFTLYAFANFDEYGLAVPTAGFTF